MNWSTKDRVWPFNRVEGIVALPGLVFLSLGWTRAAIEKIIDLDWWTGEKLQAWLLDHHESALPFLRPVMDSVVAPLALPVSMAVIAIQLGLGFNLIAQYRLRATLIAGIALNALFIGLGAVSPSAFYIIIQMALLIGVDLGLIGDSQRQASREASLIWATAAVLSMPFISTFHPAKVVDDPGMVLMVIGAIGALSEVVMLTVQGNLTLPPPFSSLGSAPNHDELWIGPGSDPDWSARTFWGDGGQAQNVQAQNVQGQNDQAQNSQGPSIGAAGGNLGLDMASTFSQDNPYWDYHYYEHSPSSDPTQRVSEPQPQHWGATSSQPAALDPALPPRPRRSTDFNQLVNRRFQPTDTFWYAPEWRQSGEFPWASAENQESPTG